MVEQPAREDLPARRAERPERSALCQELARIRKRKETILDGVTEQFNIYQKRMGKSDLRRVDEHLSSIRDIEMRLGASQATAVDISHSSRTLAGALCE